MPSSWELKKRELIIMVACAQSVDELSGIIKQITGMVVNIPPDQFATVQKNVSKVVALASNENTAKTSSIDLFSSKLETPLSPITSDSRPPYVGPVQSFYRPSSYQFGKITSQFQEEGKVKPEPFLADYSSYALYQDALKTWEQEIFELFLSQRHPFLLKQVRAKWTVPIKSEIPEIARILGKIVDSENTTSANHIPYYHGMNSMATFLMVMYDVFFQTVQQRGLVPHFSGLRMSSDKKNFDQIFKGSDFRPFIEQHLEKTRLVANLLSAEADKLKFFDNNSAITAHFLSAAPSLLADATTESPLFFFVNQMAIVLSENLLNLIIGNALRVVGLPEDKIAEQAQRYIVLAKEFAPEIKRSIAQIFIHENIINDVSYIAARGGLPFNYNRQDNSFFKDTRNFLHYFGAGGYELLESYIKDHSELKYTELAEQFSEFQSGKSYWEHGLQVRILGTSPLLEDPKNLLVKIFVDENAEASLENLRKKLGQLVSEDLDLAKE